MLAKTESVDGVDLSDLTIGIHQCLDELDGIDREAEEKRIPRILRLGRILQDGLQRLGGDQKKLKKWAEKECPGKTFQTLGRYREIIECVDENHGGDLDCISGLKTLKLIEEKLFPDKVKEKPIDSSSGKKGGSKKKVGIPVDADISPVGSVIEGMSSTTGLQQTQLVSFTGESSHSPPCDVQSPAPAVNEKKVSSKKADESQKGSGGDSFKEDSSNVDLNAIFQSLSQKQILEMLRARYAQHDYAQKAGLINALFDIDPDAFCSHFPAAVIAVASPVVAEKPAVPLTAEDAMVAVDAIAENLKSGNKVKFKNLMSRRWSAKDELKPASKPGDYLPSLPQDPDALRHLFHEFKYRLEEVREIGPEKFRRVAERRQFEGSLAFCHETIEKLRAYVIPASRTKSLFEDDKYPDVLKTKEFMEVWETRLDMMRKKGSIVADTWEPNALAKLAVVGHAKALKAVSVCNGNNGFQIMYVDYEEKGSGFKGKDPSLGVDEKTMGQIMLPWDQVAAHCKRDSFFRDRRREVRGFKGIDVDTPDVTSFA